MYFTPKVVKKNTHSKKTHAVSVKALSIAKEIREYDKPRRREKILPSDMFCRIDLAYL